MSHSKPFSDERKWTRGSFVENLYHFNAILIMRLIKKNTNFEIFKSRNVENNKRNILSHSKPFSDERKCIWGYFEVKIAHFL